jgi:hypothetical protein
MIKRKVQFKKSNKSFSEGKRVLDEKPQQQTISASKIEDRREEEILLLKIYGNKGMLWLSSNEEVGHTFPIFL